MLVPLLVMYVPSVQLGLVQPAQKLALVREENFPASHAEHDLSLVADPFAETKLPALQLRHFEQAAAFSREEKVPAPHAEHDLSLDEVPLTATKDPAVQLRRRQRRVHRLFPRHRQVSGNGYFVSHRTVRASIKRPTRRRTIPLTRIRRKDAVEDDKDYKTKQEALHTFHFSFNI